MILLAVVVKHQTKHLCIFKYFVGALKKMAIHILERYDNRFKYSVLQPQKCSLLVLFIRL